MARVDEYKKHIQSLIQEYASLSSSDREIEVETIIDTERHHYQVVNVGWVNNRRVYGCVLHIDLKNGKVWIQYNGTEMQVAEELVKLGIPKDDIVLAFHSPSKRQFTGFAVS